MNYNQNQLSFIDMLSVASFVIGLMNLDENVTQGDKQELMEDFSNKADLLLRQIHGHLQTQDQKLDNILERLEKLENDSRRNLQESSKPHDKGNDAPLGIG